MNAETREFINLYNQLESLIRSSYDLPKDAGPIYWLSHSLSSFRDVSTDLDYIRRVRNLLSHCGLVNDDYPVTPSAGMLETLRATNRAAALAPYAGHELGQVEAEPFVKAALERSPVSRAALKDAPEEEVVARLAALENDSIYDGPSRLAQPDEVWNFGRGDGLEKCLLAANVLGGDEIAVLGDTAELRKDGRVVCMFGTRKSPRDRHWRLVRASHRSVFMV